MILLGILAIVGGAALAAYAATDNTEGIDTTGQYLKAGLGMEGWGPMGGPRGKGGCFGAIEVSAEYEANVTKIAESDTDVQSLLDEGYVVAGVRPIITTKVDANGNILSTAKTAILMLEKDTAGRATVTVSLEQSKVTEIVIVTRTVIKKP